MNPRSDEAANNFTLLRVLLALMVVLGHFKLLPGTAYPPFPFNLADAAVDCFFVVSGFLITLGYEHTPSVWSFYVRRIFRLYPLYACIVLIQTAIMLALLPNGPLSEPRSTLRYLTANLVLGNFLQYDISGVLTLIFVASVAYDLVALYMQDIRLARQLPGQLQFFVAGMALYLYGARLRIHPLASVAIAVVFLIAWSVFDPIPAGIRPVLVAAFVYSFALCLPVVRLRTDISYSVYLLHGPLIQTLILLGLFRDTIPFLAGVVAMVIAVAVVTERLVERPGTAFGRRLSLRICRRRPAMPGMA